MGASVKVHAVSFIEVDIRLQMAFTVNVDLDLNFQRQKCGMRIRRKNGERAIMCNVFYRFLDEMQRIAFRLMLSSCVCVCLCVCVCVCLSVCVCRVCGPQENGLR